LSGILVDRPRDRELIDATEFCICVEARAGELPVKSPNLFPKAPLVPHFLFDRLALGGVEAAGAIGGAKFHTPQTALAIKLAM
jgi:hypothetical protein